MDLNMDCPNCKENVEVDRADLSHFFSTKVDIMCPHCEDEFKASWENFYTDDELKCG